MPWPATSSRTAAGHRLFLVVSGAFFIRLVLFLSGVVFKGPFGFNPQTFTGPFLTFLTFGQYLVPLAVFEVYFHAQDRPSARNRFAAASLLFVLTLVMIGGIFAVTLTTWMPQVRAAYDPRKSIAETLSATIASSGIDAAAKQYHDLKAGQPATYDFDETELNTLGYDLIRARKFKEAIRILQLNVEAYPQSSNVYDSLGEAYMDDGNKPLAIVNYQKSLELNPKNYGAVVALQKLNAP
jgi:tetratricopeptide (TPR) repeat protein